jgi:1-acyl-sn-glycerol-3-phosphate acyltransferase
MSSSPLVYLRLLYRIPFLALVTLACLGYARLTGRRKRAYRLWAILYGRICGRELVISGAAPDSSAQLIVANHTSYLDAFPLAYLWPEVHPVATHRIRSWFLLGSLSSKTAIFVDDSVAESRRQAREEMRMVWESGGAVLVFPEGKASHGAPPSISLLETWRSRAQTRPIGPGPFRLGPFEEAAACAITVQGVRIEYPRELLAGLGGRWFEEKFLWVLCQNFAISVHLFPAERASGDAASLARTWGRRLLPRDAGALPTLSF